MRRMGLLALGLALFGLGDTPALADKRIALVVGNSRYQNVAPLNNPGNDATLMAETLRGGLSFGLSGFTFWSHDIGGFAAKTPEELYRRWMPFGMLTSHSRCHGAPPKEPWEYSAAFMDDFRRADEMKYRLMPYIYAQAKDSSMRGLPMVRAVFIEYPDDPGSWQVEDESGMFPMIRQPDCGRRAFARHGSAVFSQACCSGTATATSPPSFCIRKPRNPIAMSRWRRFTTHCINSRPPAS